MQHPSAQIDTVKLLGSHKRTFRPRVLPGRVLLGVTIFSFLMSVLEFITAFKKYISPPSELLSDKFRQDRITMAIILGVVFVLVAVVNGIFYYVHKKHRVDLYDNGFIISNWRHSLVFPWERMSDVKKESVRRQYGKDWEIHVTRDDGEKATIRGLDGIKALGDAIELGTFST